jgi:hypothetical protein
MQFFVVVVAGMNENAAAVTFLKNNDIPGNISENRLSCVRLSLSFTSYY